jgi:asparagine synthase (glutamine-hydrolysing)
MSGIVGILHLDRSPVEVPLLQKLTEFMVFRGPDAKAIWIDERDGGYVGFGHTLLKTHNETERKSQPLTVDGRMWIVADARVDGRSDLKAKLQSHGHCDLKDASDAELLLRAYGVWEENCVDHLLGDFVFAIWDRRRQRLFCARDHFGIKPFFYAHVGAHFIFSNTLECIRQHPGISAKLNDLAIADFLLFDMNQDLGTTSFADIQRMPPAHILECQAGRIAIRRYWTLPAPPAIRRGQAGDCVEQFKELMDAAVADRLRTDSAAVLMSGGLDSPTVAASAQRVLKRNGHATELCAYTEVFDRLIPHEERHYAGLVAQALQIPIQYRGGDDCKLYDIFDDPGFNSPEPAHLPWGTSSIEQLRDVATRSRVALTGFGADPALSSSLSSHFRTLLRDKHFGRALADAAGYLSAQGRISRLYLHTRWRLFLNAKGERPSFPQWLDEDLEKRLGLRDRWNLFDREKADNAAVRPGAYQLVTASFWTDMFDQYDPGVTGVPVGVRHPFFDLRLLNFLLGLPALPWCSDKELLREAARGTLPEEVRLRRKSPLIAEPLLALLQKPESAWVDQFKPAPELECYVVRNRIPQIHGQKNVWGAWIDLRPLSLNFWLQGVRTRKNRCALRVHMQ